MDEHIPFLKRINSFIHAQDCLAGIQIAHAGRKASTFPPFFSQSRVGIEETSEIKGWKPIGPSPIAWGDKFVEPHEMSIAEIGETVNCFREAAKRAIKADFDVLEIHGAHGYLISSFNSPLANVRKDEYGGSFENRIRFCLETVKAVREVWPDDKPLFVRLSCSDWVEGGWSMDDTVKLSQILKSMGVDLIDCSSGGNSPLQKVKEAPGYQVPFASQVRAETGIATAAVGKITEAQQAEEILQQKHADLVVLARGILGDPYWPLRAAKSLGIETYSCLQYSFARI